MKKEVKGRLEKRLARVSDAVKTAREEFAKNPHITDFELYKLLNQGISSRQPEHISRTNIRGWLVGFRLEVEDQKERQTPTTPKVTPGRDSSEDEFYQGRRRQILSTRGPDGTLPTLEQVSQLTGLSKQQVRRTARRYSDLKFRKRSS